jgi:sugar phosphate isomerase/epimerase
MDAQATRRNFLRGAASLAGLASAGASPVINEAGPTGFKLGVASFSLREFQRGLAIKMIQELKTPYVSVKEFHLPYRSSVEELEKGRRDFEEAGIRIMSGGNILLQSEDPAELRKYFQYAKTCGMPMMVCAPTHKTLNTVEKLVKEFDIRIAIHNHGPEDKHFPTPQSVLAEVKNMDLRCGLCMDIGHSARTGVDLIQSLVEAGTRLFDMHIKDLRSFSDKESQCDVGEGAIPVVAIFKQLKKMNYQGCVNLEYEINSGQPLLGMHKSLCYMRGVLAGLQG